MSENDSLGNEKPVTPAVGTQFGVMLPCAPDQFGEFVSGLLGKPQTIEKSMHGIFELERQDVVNTFHLLDQRIHQQNDASLIQFTVRILYDDDSSVLLNSISDFESYTEIRPIASIGVVLSWTYLIKFKNKRVPEKQEVSLSFRSGDDEIGVGSLIVDDGIVVRKSRSWYGSGIFLRVSHTERTWGVDIESLLTGHVKSLFKHSSNAEKFIYKNSGEIGLSAGIIFFLSAIVGVVITSSRFIEVYLDKVHALSTETANSAVVMASKLDFLVEVISTGVWPRFIFSVIVFLLISLILSIALGVWVGTKADNRPMSYVLLSKAAVERRSKSITKLQRDWYMFAVSVAVSVVTGVVSNIIFTKYFGVLT